MKKEILFGVVCSIFLFSFVSFADVKIGYVDLQKIFTGYKKAIESEDAFKKEVETEQKKINDLQEEIKKMQADYDAKKDVLKPEEKTKKEDELKTKMEDFTKQWSEVNKKLNDRSNEITNQRLEEIKNAISEYGKKNGYSIIINNINNQVILYGDEKGDLTDEIIQVLNSINTQSTPLPESSK